MKKVLFLVIVVVSCTCAYAQKAKPAVKPVSPLKSLSDSASYAVGLSVAAFYKQQGITGLNSNVVSKAINDGMTGKKTLLDEAAANTAIVTYMNQLGAKKSKVRIDEGNKFLAANKAKPGVKVTASGLQYEVVTEGTGIKPTAITDTVVCNYKGTFLNGEEFDNSFKRGEPATFTLNRVITGWTEALQLMSVGSKYKLYVPYQLGYGATDYIPQPGGPVAIPGGSALLFELELLDVRKQQ